MLRTFLFAFPVVWFAACRSTHPAPPPTTPAAPAVVKVNEVAAALAPGLTLDANDPATCEACHAAVVSEWKESLHARAHHSKDPLYAAVRALRTEKQGPHIPGACAQCHNTRDPVDHESKAAQAGVTCATCHQLEGVHPGRKGLAGLMVGPEKRFRGPHDIADGTSPLHANGPALDALKDGTTLCLACHGEEQNPAGVPTCTTGPEYVVSKETKSCTSCHMKELEGRSGAVITTRTTHRSHHFAGPYQQQRLASPGMLEEAVGLTGRLDDEPVDGREREGGEGRGRRVLRGEDSSAKFLAQEVRPNTAFR